MRLLKNKTGIDWRSSPALQNLRSWIFPEDSTRERLARFIVHPLRSLRNHRLLSRLPKFLQKLAGRTGLNSFAGNHNAGQSNLSGSVDSAAIKKTDEFLARTRLNILLSSDAIIELPLYPEPLVSIILLFYNRAEVSLQCLETLSEAAGGVPFEVIIIDNASTDQTSLLLDRIKNARIVRNLENQGFGGGCNQAADLASGRYLFFLNNDTRLIPNSLKVMVDTLEAEENIGAVGGRLIFPDGRLQEAGSIIWRDGTCVGYGRDDNPFKPEYSYKRDVDFCSGAMLLTPRELFLSLGKFDPRYQPAYYEDADYCMQLWQAGYRVVYQPFAIVVHHEYGSGGSSNALALQQRNWEEFRKKWQAVLGNHQAPKPGAVVLARQHGSKSKRILIFDDHTPDYRLGAGYPRTYRILETLVGMGYQVTYLPVLRRQFIPEIVQPLQRKGVEILFDSSDRIIEIESFLQSRPDYYDVVMVCRPHNMRIVRGFLPKYVTRAACIYDAEALFSLRRLRFNELKGIHWSERKQEQLVLDEVGLIKGAEVVTAVSPLEKEVLQKYGTPRVEILGHVVNPDPTPRAFEDRQGLLFVGGILDSPSPNEDAVLYFAREIFPLIRRELDCDFFVVGSNRIKSIWDLESDSIHVIGRVEDLRPYYDACRVFVVPTRYAGGIPIKMLDAAANGLPGVVTPLIASQLGWKEDEEFLIGRDPAGFASRTISLYTDRDLFLRLRDNALQRVYSDYSLERFEKDLRSVVEMAIDLKASGMRD